MKLIGGLSVSSLSQGALSGGQEMSLPMTEVFNITRYDRLSGSGSPPASSAARRGRTSPATSTPAWDQPSTARKPNHGDEGEVRGTAPYFSNLDATGTTAPKTNGAMFSPNRVDSFGWGLRLDCRAGVSRQCPVADTPLPAGPRALESAI